MQAFKTDFSVAYIPDKLYLPPAADPTGASSQYISSLWPRIQTAAFSNGPYWGVPQGKTYVLQGYQTIVFFLGRRRTLHFRQSATASASPQIRPIR